MNSECKICGNCISGFSSICEECSLAELNAKGYSYCRKCKSSFPLWSNWVGGYCQECHAKCCKETQRKRLKQNPLFSLSHKIRTSINTHLRNRDLKKDKSTEEILGIDFEGFYNHIESQFYAGMSWDNRGEWELDHIIPMATAETEADVIRLNHYSNLQPLWKADNRSKRATLPKVSQLEEV